jgi:hypothetical protein
MSGSTLGDQAMASILCGRGEIIDNAVEELRDVHHILGRVVCARLDLCNPQKCTERLEDRVRLRDGMPERVLQLLHGGRAPSRKLQSLPQARKRCPEIVGNIVRDLPDAVHQFFDPVQHRIHAAGQFIEFIARAARSAPRGKDSLP